MGFPAKLSTGDLARLLGITPRRVEQLAADGVLARIAHGQFAAAPSIKAYVAFARKAAIDEAGRYAGLPKERAGLVRVQRQLAEMERDRISGMTVLVEDAAREVTAALVLVRNLFLGLPAKLAPRIIHCKTAAEAKALLQGEIENILRELSSAPDDDEDADAS